MARAHAGHERLRLPRWVRLSVYVLGGLCALSGTAWLLLHHFAQRAGEFGLTPHPLEHPSLVVHGLSGLGMLWLLGVIWLAHVRRGWRQPRRHWPGVLMLVLMLWLSASAAGLYYLGDPVWRDVASLGHWSLGLFAVAWLPWHIVHGRRAARRAQAGG